LGLNAFVPFAFFIKPIQKSYDLNLRILSKIIFLYLKPLTGNLNDGIMPSNLITAEGHLLSSVWTLDMQIKIYKI